MIKTISSLLVILIYFFIFNTTIYGKENKNIFTKEEINWIKQNPKVSIAMLNNFAPFSYTVNGIHEGFSVDLTKEIEKITGLEFEYKLSRWSEALTSFREGKVDMIADISFTKKRELFTLYTQQYYEIPTFVFGLKTDNSYEGIKSLEGKIVAVSKNLFYIDTLESMGLELLEIESNTDKAKAVITGRADYFISSYTTGIKMINDNAYTTLKPLDDLEKIKKEDLRFGINIDRPILQSIIRKALKQINHSQIKQLSNKWIMNSNENKDIIEFTPLEKDYISKNPTITYSEINWKPLSIIEDGRMKGIMGDYLDVVSKRTGLNFKYIPSKSWPEVLEKFAKGEIDLVPGVGSSPQERELGLISNRYAKYPLAIVTAKKFTYIESIGDLSENVIAVPKYYTSYNFIVKNFPEIKLIPTKTIQEALLLVENGQADAFVGHIASSLYYISELHLQDLKIAGTSQFDFEHHYLIQKNNPILLSIINKTFNSISYEERKDIYSKWVQTTIIEQRSNKKIIYIILAISTIIILAFVYRQRLLKRYNKKLKESNDEIQSIMNSTLEAIIISYEGRCVDLNSSAQNMFKVQKKEDALGKNILDYIQKDSVELIKSKLKFDEVEPYELNCIRFDKEVFPALIKGTNIQMNNKTLRITSIIDISEIKQKERLLVEQSKMAAVGEMIGNIAHQWRQPLSVITTIVSGWNVYNDYGKFDKKVVLNEADIILFHAKYLSQTIDDFRQFIKGEKTTKQFDLVSTSENLFRLVNSSIKANQITLEKNIETKSLVSGNANELLQALINIINNSIDAIKSMDMVDGIIFFCVYDQEDKVVIEIYDNGGGIKEEVLNSIFEPYFTTKHKSNGTGLGLYMTYNILNKLNGTIKVTNKTFSYNDKEFKGASFVITLPSI